MTTATTATPTKLETRFETGAPDGDTGYRAPAIARSAPAASRSAATGTSRTSATATSSTSCRSTRSSAR
jgi:hypothetical protein